MENIINKYGTEIKIIKYNNNKNIEIEVVDNGFRMSCEKRNINNNNIKTPYCKSVYGVGYLGEDFYKQKGIKNLIQYQTWRNMIKRCYCEKALNVNYTYRKVEVCEEWHNFSRFKTWYDENYYEVDGEIMCLDKDILVKNSNLYSPNTCMFVPSFINHRFPKCDKARGELPIGVRWIKADCIYGSACRDGNGNTWLGRFKNPIDAFNCYKEHKEKSLKETANSYKDKIPQKLYNALYSYSVEITD